MFGEFQEEGASVAERRSSSAQEPETGSHRLRPRSLGNDAHSISRRFRYIMSDILCLVILRWSDWYAQELIS